MSTPTSGNQPDSPPHLDPPFRGYIETTYDSLLVFEAARRGLIPRVTRRLIERERGMVQSGAVFVFDEQESGIKRWTDGLVWSPSRILGNFLVYRETDKRAAHANASKDQVDYVNQDSPSATPGRGMAPPNQYGESSQMSAQGSGEIPILAQGAIRPRSASDGGMDRQRERQLVGSLTNSYKFREGGLVKKTMSVSIGNYSQHMISYYTVADVMSGKLRAPSTIPELASLEISSDYLEKQNFRFPPLVEVGLDGVSRYRGEAEEPISPETPMTGFSLQTAPTPTDPYDPYGGHARGVSQLSLEPSRQPPHGRGFTHPQHIPMTIQSPHSPLPPTPYMPGSAGSQYFEHNYPSSSSAPSAGASTSHPIPIQRQASGGPHRPSSSKARYDPYGSGSPRVASLGHSPAGHPHYGPPSAGLPGSAGSSLGLGAGPSASPMNRRQSVPQPPPHHHEYNHQQLHPHHQQHHPQQPQDYYQQYDVKPTIHASGAASYSYQPPATAPGSFAGYYQHHPSGPPPHMTSPLVGYAAGPASAGHGPEHPHGPGSGGYPVPSWHTAPNSAPPPSSQSRLLPAQSREYVPMHEQHRSSAGEYPGASVGPAPSSSGSGSGRSQPPAPGSGGGYPGAPGQPGSNVGGGGWPGPNTIPRAHLGPAGAVAISPTQSTHSASGLAHLSSPIPPTAARPDAAGADLGGGMAAMNVGQYMPEDGWSNSTPA